jgi:hypothetical protein
MIKHPFVGGVLTFRLIIWLGAVIIAPVVMKELSRQKEIEGEMDYFESLVLSLLLFGIAFVPFILPKISLVAFKKHFWTVASLWGIAGSLLNGYIITAYKKIAYWKSLLLWVLTLIVSYTGGFVLASFSLFLLRTLK